MGVNVTLNYEAVTPKVNAAVRTALTDVAEACLEEANRTVPLEDGPLQGSGHVSGVGSNASTASRSVVYATPYAVVQHEDSSLSHDAGRRSHWLELTVSENSTTYAEHIAAAVKARLT